MGTEDQNYSVSGAVKLDIVLTARSVQNQELLQSVHPLVGNLIVDLKEKVKVRVKEIVLLDRVPEKAHAGAGIRMHLADLGTIANLSILVQEVLWLRPSPVKEIIARMQVALRRGW